MNTDSQVNAGPPQVDLHPLGGPAARLGWGHPVALALLLCATPPLTAGAEKTAAERIEEFPNKSSLEARIHRGDIVFQHYCILCHGTKADGNGRAAKLYSPRPANLLTSDKNDEYKELIIRRGGAALARSEFMPPWGDELTDEQIKDVIGFLASIQQRKP